MKKAYYDTRKLRLEEYSFKLDKKPVCPQCERPLKIIDRESYFWAGPSTGYFCHADCASIYANNVVAKLMGDEFNKVKI